MPQFQLQRLSRTEPVASRARRRPPVRALVRALAVAGVVSHLGLAGVSPATAQVLPSGLNVVHGQAAAVVKGNQMTVTNSANAVLNWQAFSVGAGQQVRFDQPAASSRVLNRVVGNDASQIFGSISSNGQVWLLNPRGVLFGRDARVDVGSLVVSTLGLPLADWINGHGTLSLTTMAGAGAAPIVNQGELRAVSGGRVWLLGGEGGVRNEGLIAAPDGQVVLAAGRSVDLVDERLPHVAVRVSAPGAEVLNLGSVTAGGGRVDLLSAVVNQSGIVQADSMGTAGGVVRLQATESVQMAAGSVTSASGSGGGGVLIDAGPAGTLLAAGTVQAIGRAGRGGEVQMLGWHVGLTDVATVDASGAAGGGQVFVGGGLQGKDASLRNAEAVYFGPAATVRADATDNGDGGRIILWGDHATRAYGTLSARGGAAGGDGGFIETSGGWLDARPASVRTDAPMGRVGQWLLDPFDIDIVSGVGDAGFGSGPSFVSSLGATQLGIDTIIAALDTSDVTITTGSGGSGQGDIGMSSVTLSVSPPGPRTLTLDAAHDINLVFSTIETTAAFPLTVNLLAGNDIYLDNSALVSYGGPLTIDMKATTGAITVLSSPNIYGRPLAVNLDAAQDILFQDSTIESGNGSFPVTFKAGGSISVVSTGSGANILANDGPLGLTFTALGGNIDIDSAYISTTNGAAVVNLSATGNIDIHNFALINSWGGPLTMGATAGADISVSLFSEIYSSGGSANVTLTAAGTIVVENSSEIRSSGGPLTVSMTAGTSININNSDIYSLDALTLNLSALGSDVNILDSDFYTTGGALAVDISAADRIEITSSNFYSIDGYHDLTFDAGVDIFIYNSYIDSYPGGSGAAPMSVTMSAGRDISIDNGYIGHLTEPPLTLQIDAGRDLYIGESDILGAGSPSSAYLSAGGSINFISTSTSLYLTGDSGVTLASPAINITGSGLDIDVDGPISVFTDSFINNGTTYLWSRASGTAITLTGFVNPNTTTFENTGSLDLCACFSGSRWLVYLTDDASDVSGLDFNFLQYGTTYPSAPVVAATGNGVVFSSAAVLTVSNASLITKVYDGTTVVMPADPPLQLTGLRPGHFFPAPVSLGDVVIGNYISPNVGSDLQIGASGLVIPSIEVQSYGGPVPVYGYTAAYDLRGDIMRRPVALSGVTVANKVYDGNRNALLSGGSLLNLVPGETLGLTLTSGLFDTANVGTGKTVIGTVALANGTGQTSNYQLTGGGAFSTAADITARPLSLSGVLAADKVYDGTRDATLSGGSLGNLVAGQTLGLSLTNGLFDTANAGTDKPVTGTAILANGTGLASNYQLPAGGAISTTADITPRPLALSGVLAADKVYDGTRDATLSGGSLSNLVSGETLGVTLSNGLFNTANAGTGKPVTGSAALANGTGLASNYQLTSGAAISTTAAINPRSLTLSGVVAVDKEYDGTRTAAFSGGSLANLVPGETLAVAVTDGLFDTANAGTGKPVTGTALLADGSGLASNYQLTSGAAISTSAAISPRQLTLGDVQAADKVYDGVRDATLSGGSLGNLVTGQTLGLTLADGLFDTADVGIDKLVTGTATLANGTGLASNYQLPAGGAISTTADITPRPLTLSGVQAADKVYDGIRDAALSGGSLGNLVAGQTLGLTLGNGQFDTAHVGTDKPVTGTAVLANGTGLASNYQLPAGGAISTSADVTPRPLALSGVLAADKVYDGTRDASLSGGSLANLVSGETLGLTFSNGLFDTADAGTGKPVTGSAALADGTGLASNYQLTSGAAISTSAAIDPRPLTFSGVSAADKVYDGMRDATLSGGSLGNLVTGETLGLTLTDGLFDTANAGSGKPVTATATLVDASGLASNYTLGNAIAVATTASIEQRPLTLSGVLAADKVYDGARDATLSGGSLGNLVAGETLGLALSGGLFDTANAGVAKPVAGTATLSDGTGQVANYVLPNNGAVNATATIDPRPLTLSGVSAADKVYDGMRDATLSGGSLGNLVTGETLGLTLTDGLFDTANAGSGKPVTATATLVDASGLASNYTLGNAIAVATTASIEQRPLTLSGVLAADKVYDGARDATLSGGSLGNLVAGETLGLALSGGLFDTANAGVAKPVAGTATLSDGTGQVANYVLPNNGAVNATATIDPRPLTLSGVSAADKVYDGMRDATLSGGSLGNLVTGETLGLTLTDGLFDTANAGSGKPVTATATLVDASGLASNYTLGNAIAVATTASIGQRPLTLSGVLAADKVYDGARDATLSGGSLGNLVAGQTLTLVYSPGLFDTADVGTLKAVSGTATLGSGTGSAANYRLPDGGAVATTASIGPRSVTLSGVAAADKVYDGTRTASLSGGQLANLVAGESLGVALSGGLFDTANVGLDKPVTGSAALADGSGKASNYRLSSPGVTTSADISPAQLQYLADPVTTLQGQLPATLTGQVSGFVAGETLGTATTGTLGFATPASASSLPGSYAVNGFGLLAINYTLAQAPGNASAMTIVPPTPTVVAANEVAILADSLRPEPLPTLTPVRDLATMRTLDALQGMRMDRQGAQVFGSIDVDAYSWDALGVLLEARNAFKNSVFDTAMKRLAADPGLADLPPCIDIADLEVGRCLVSDELLAKAEGEQGTGAGVGALAGMTPPPPPKPVAAPAPALAAAPPAAPAPTTPGPAATAPAPAPAAPISVAVVRPKTVALAKAPPIPAPRAVRAAALPQIQRKIAVLVGLDNYVDDRIPLLENAGRDVEAVARVLETQLGYQTVVVRDASREAIIGVLNKLALTARPNDSVVVYYAGHGTVVDETGLGYWIPASADAERPESWISNNDIGKLVGSIRASQVVLISDSCFSGSLVSERRVLVAGRADDPGALLQRRAAVVMSSGGNEPVADGARNGHSPFASSLMQSLSQLDSWRPGNTVFEQIRLDVTRRLPQTPHYGAARLGRHAEGADFVFEQRQLEQTLR